MQLHVRRIIIAKEKYYHVHGNDLYERDASLTINRNSDTWKIEILSSEKGDPVVFLVKEVKELIDTLKKCLKE